MSNLARLMYGSESETATDGLLVHGRAGVIRSARSRLFAARIAELKLRHGFSERELAIVLCVDDKDAHTLLTGKASAEHYAATLAKSSGARRTRAS